MHVCDYMGVHVCGIRFRTIPPCVSLYILYSFLQSQFFVELNIYCALVPPVLSLCSLSLSPPTPPNLNSPCNIFMIWMARVIIRDTTSPPIRRQRKIMSLHTLEEALETYHTDGRHHLSDPRQHFQKDRSDDREECVLLYCRVLAMLYCTSIYIVK